MEDIIDKKWWACSTENKRFSILGYSTENTDHRDDATKALEILSKHINEPIPSDVEVFIIP